jgi:hypothetical protein
LSYFEFKIFGCLKLFDELGVGFYEFDLEKLYLRFCAVLSLERVVEGMGVI